MQTEDSGVQRAVVSTHVFADGGCVVGSIRTSYAHLLSSADYAEPLTELMRLQHKAAARALMNGNLDDRIKESLPPPEDRESVNDLAPPSHAFRDGHVVTEEVPTSTRRYFNAVTVMLDVRAPEVGAALVDLENGSALSLRSRPCVDCGQTITDMVRALERSFGVCPHIGYVGSGIAWAILRHGARVLFLESVIRNPTAASRFRAAMHEAQGLIQAF